MELDALFSPIVVSAECGSGKEGPAIFRLALARLCVAPDEAIFIDNSEPNLRAARGLGIQTVHFDDTANDIRGLAATLQLEHGVNLG